MSGFQNELLVGLTLFLFIIFIHGENKNFILKIKIPSFASKHLKFKSFSVFIHKDTHTYSYSYVLQVASILRPIHVVLKVVCRCHFFMI